MDFNGLGVLIDKLFDNFKKITPLLVTIVISTGIILFASDMLLLRLGLFEIACRQRAYIGITFIISFGLCITILSYEFVDKIFLSKRKYKNMCKKVKSLSRNQKAILVSMLESPNKNIELNATSGDVAYLQTYAMIHSPQQIVIGDFNKRTYMPQPWIIDLYNEKPELFR